MAAAPRPVSLLEQACRGSRRNPLQYQQSPVPGRPVVAVTTSAQGGLFVIRAHATPTLRVATASKLAATKTRALIASHEYGSNRIGGIRCLSRNCSG
jgi:hypothetical protein